ncbi:hypothetical protein ACMD2_00843 [Ananas comosus]|uniref:Uncharacterized protein n=1 Tax=Ananas comosus TaxID=4615 RepID=A0A199UM09_ANACO|nr:hypothetical protein ACMD2_00843 [Ananas comosus]
MGDSTRSSPITFGGGGVLAGDDTSSAPEPAAQIGSASGSYQNEGLLGGGEGGGVSGSDAEFGYGYVAPDDVPALLEQHIGKGEIVDNLWRGQMGLSEQEQKKALELLRHHVNGAIEQSTKGPVEAAATEALSASDTVSGGCCGGTGSSTCCPNGTLKEKPEKSSLDEKPVEKENAEKESSSGMSKAKGPSTRKICPMPTWYETWEREDTYAALAVVAAIASVAVAYSFYKQLR